MGGRINYAIMAEVAEQESQIKSDRVKAKHNALRASGSIVGRAGWGYEIVRVDGLKVLSPTVEGARYVPLIFDRVITGDSRRDIAAWLDAEGIATANGGKWSETVSAT